MRPLTGLLIALLVSFPFAGKAQQKAEPKPPVKSATVTKLEGTLQTATAETGPWTPLKLKASVPEGAIVKTGPKSRAELSLPGDSVLRIGPDSRLKLNKLLFPADKQNAQVEARLISGRVWARVMNLFGGPAEPRFRVSAGNAVAGVRGTAFEINFAPITGENLNPDKPADEPAGNGDLRVYEGKVAVARYNPFKPAEAHQGGGLVPPTDVQGPDTVPPPFKDVSREEWTQLVVAGMQMPFGAGDPAKADPVKIDNQKDMQDDFTRWNRELDGLTKLPQSPE